MTNPKARSLTEADFPASSHTKQPFPCTAADMPCELCVETPQVGLIAHLGDKGGTFLCSKDWQGAHPFFFFFFYILQCFRLIKSRSLWSIYKAFNKRQRNWKADQFPEVAKVQEIVNCISLLKEVDNHLCSLRFTLHVPLTSLPDEGKRIKTWPVSYRTGWKKTNLSAGKEECLIPQHPVKSLLLQKMWT